MTLYEIDSSLMSLVDEETGEILDKEAFDAVVMERDTKIENVALWVKNPSGNNRQNRYNRQEEDRREPGQEPEELPAVFPPGREVQHSQGEDQLHQQHGHQVRERERLHRMGQGKAA